MLERLIRIITDRPWVIVAAFTGITLLLGSGLFSPRFDVSVEKFMTDEQTADFRYERYREAFGEDSDLIIIFDAGDAFSDDTLRMLERLEGQLLDIPHVELVISLAGAFEITWVGGLPRMEPLVPDLPLTDQQRAESRARARAADAWSGIVASENDRYTGVNIITRDPGAGLDAAEAHQERLQLVDTIVNVVEQTAGDTSFVVAGWPYIKQHLEAAVLHDLMIIAPAIVLTSMLFMWIGFRRFSLLVIGGCAVGLTLIWTTGSFFLAGRTLNMASAMLPTLVLAISFAQLIFVLAQFDRSRSGGTAGIVETLQKAAPPCFIGALTTSAGFLSLTATGIGPIQEFGLFAAIGIIYAFLNAVILVPALLTLWPGLDPSPSRKDFSVALSRILARLSQNNRLVLILAAIIILIAVLGAFQVRTETNLESFFMPDHPVNRGVDGLNNLFGAVNAVDFIIERADGGRLTAGDLEQIRDIETVFNKQPETVRTVGALDFGRLIAGSTERFIQMWSGDGQAGGALLGLLAGSPALNRQISTDQTAMRMTALLNLSSAEFSLEYARRMSRLAADIAPQLSVTASGQGMLLAGMSERLLGAQMTSVGLILLFVTLVVSFVHRSWLIGLVSLLPNATPIFLTLGIMGWTGIPLNVITVMVSSIAIGIAVDDTIHFLHYLRHRLAEGLPMQEAVDETIRAKGRPIAFTSMLLTTAFLTHMLSSFLPTVYLGVLSALTMIGALLGDLILLPALMQLIAAKIPLSSISTDQTHKRET